MNHIYSILIVGSYGTFTEELINKLNKEDWRVFTLVSENCTKPSRVFEQYHFDYTSDSVEEIVGSCRPDVILYTGAYDPLYTWEDKSQKEVSRNFIAGLDNLLMCAHDFHVSHFVFLSSECVFEEPYIFNIGEDVNCAPVSYKGITMSLGEKMVASFGEISSVEVSILRIADMYFIPKNDKECKDHFTSMCLNALSSGSLSINAKKIRSPLYISDAIQAIFLLISAPERKQSIYHISSEQEVSEYDIAQSIKGAASRPISFVDQTIGIKNRTVLSGQRFCEEFDFAVRVSYSEIIPKIIRFMQSHLQQFNINKTYGNTLKAYIQRFVKRISEIFPLIECIALFFLFYLLNSLTSKISYFQGVDFYLFFVLLFAIIRGWKYAIFAFVLSVAGYCYQQAQVQSGLALLINVKTYIWIAELFVIGIGTGSLRDKLIQLEQEKDKEIKFLSGRIEEISLINSSNTKIKNYFQERVINSNESIGWFYEIISQLDNADSGEVLFIATTLLSKIMGSKDVAIYSASESGDYCRLVTSTTPRARSLGKSIHMQQQELLFQPLQNQNIFINRAMDTGMPSLASSLVDSSGNIRIVIFLWDMVYEKMTLYSVNTLKVLGALIYNAVIRSVTYMDALASKRLIPGTTILQQFAFEEMHTIYQKAGRENLMEYSILVIEEGNIPIEAWSKKLEMLLRQSDIVGLLSNHQIGILLSNASKEEARLVIERLRSRNIIANFIEEITDI